MTVSSSTSKVTYSGNGSTTVFPYTFKILDQDEVLVQLKVNATGVITTQTITTHYAVSGVGASAGGNITMVTAPASGTTLIITRNMAFTQETDYTEYDAFPADTHETALDRLTMQVQQVKEVADRAIKFDSAVTGFDTTLPSPDAGYVLAINDTEDGWDLVTLSNLTTDLTLPAGEGIIAKTGAATSALRTITGTAGEIVVTNGDGLSGNPTISIDPAFGGAPAIGDITGMGTGVATFLATPSSANLKAAVTDETGSGGALVFATSPTLTTPVIGTIADANGNESLIMTATSSAVNEITLTNAATGTAPILASSGGDTNIDLRLRAKGTGQTSLQSTGGTHAVYTGSGYQHATLWSYPTTSATRTITIPDCDVSGMYVQQAFTSSGTSATGTTMIPRDNTIPQNTEGDQYMTLAITPKSTSNLLDITVVFFGSASTAGTFCVSLFQDSTANSLASVAQYIDTSTAERCTVLRHRMSAGTTSSTTFKVRAGNSTAGTTTFNGQGGTQLYGGVAMSSITIKEYSA